MKVLVIVLLSLIILPLFAGEQINLSATQITNLGIKLGKLEMIQSVPLLAAPAKVSVPPAQEYLVSSSYAGLVSQINVSVGDEVKKNQVLASLNSPELLALQQQHLSSLNDVRLAKTEFVRDQKLHNEGVIADRRWLQTKTRYQIFMARFNESRQLLEIAGISQDAIKSLEVTGKLSSQLNIVAPISGVILQRMITSGERIEALTSLFRVANLKIFWLDISIPQHHIDRVQFNDQVVIEGVGVTARIFLVTKNVDEKNQTVLVRALVDSAHDNIKLGQTVNVKVSQSSEQPVFKVADTALAQAGGVAYVFVRNITGFAMQPVQVLGRQSQESIISGDLQEGSEIAIKGAVALKAIYVGLGEDE